MPTLYRTVCNTDWKGRPSHNLEILGSGTREELLALQDKDVEDVKASDLLADREIAEADGEEPPTEWCMSNERWEMDDADKRGGLRQLAYKCNGDLSSICYHILD